MIHLRPKNKLARLASARRGWAVVMAVMAFATAPTILDAASLESIVGSTCLVPVIHTNFAFPPEGGKIVKIGEQMYFVQDYRPECANAGANGQLIKGSGTVAGTTTPQPSPTTNQNSYPSCMYYVN
jgi:hypothetical protein